FSSTPATSGSAECLDMTWSSPARTTRMGRTLVVKGKRVIRPGSTGPASIHIQDGVIMAIEKFDSAPAGIELVDAGDSVVMPGLVGTNVHLNEPGRADWEGFHFGTRSAAAGVVTTLLDMPLDSNL